MKKFLIASLIFLSIFSFSEDTLIKKIYYGSIIDVIDSKKLKTNSEKTKYLKEHKQEILDLVTTKVYSLIEADYSAQRLEYIDKKASENVLFDKYNISLEDDKLIFEEIISKVLNKYGYTNTVVLLEINISKKFADVTIFEAAKLDNYDKQIFNLLITNMVKSITTEEFTVNIFEK